MFLYTEQILVIDLSTQTSEIKELDLTMVESHIGGRLLTSKLLEMHRGEDPVVIGTGPLTGTLAPGAAAAVISAFGPGERVVHLPVTHFIGSEVKYSGFDFIVIKGKAVNPVYLWLHDGVVNFNDAAKIWGTDTWNTVDWIKKEKGDDLVQVLAIGPAGEKGHPHAQLTINYWNSTDSYGLGRLFGDKNLKAIALRGLGLLEAEAAEEMVEESIALQQEILTGNLNSSVQGINSIVSPSRASAIQAWLLPLIHRHKSCFGCVRACYTFIKYNEDPHQLESTAVREPGFLLTHPQAVEMFYEAGFAAEDAGRLMEICARLGWDPVAAVSFLKANDIHNFSGGKELLYTLVDKPADISGFNLETDSAGGQEFDGLTLGICPELLKHFPAEQIDGMNAKFLKLVSLGTGIGEEKLAVNMSGLTE